MRDCQMRCLNWLSAAAVAIFLSLPVMLHAQVAVVPPPQFSGCWPGTPPVLPPRWRAVGLMSPLLEDQLDVGEFIYDSSVQAMRATVYGVESGAADLLITNSESYLLSGPYEAPTGCRSLGRKFAPPPPQWLGGRAACVGEAHLNGTPVQWWKTPGSEGEASWHWYRSDTRMPWRTMFVRRAPDLPVIGDYAMTNFPAFQPLAQTNLPKLRDFCDAQPKTIDASAAAAQSARDLMSIRNEAAEDQRADRIAALIPGLSYQGCARMTPVRWPEQFVATAVITPISFNDQPYSGLIYYDWPDAASQFAILWQGVSPAFKGVVALKKGVGYQPRRLPDGAFQCHAIYPGMVRPDWASAAGCQCKGVLDNNPALSPNAVTQIFSCPIKWQPRRIMWNWYTTDGRPVVFAEASARGVGAMLADYHRWLPGQKVPASDFNLPPVCTPDNGAAAGDSRNPSCSDCHTTR